MIELNVHNETSQLEIVVLGIPNNFGGVPNVEKCYDPKSKQHILDGTFPIQKDVTSEMNEFLDLLEKYNVEVLRPNNIPNLNQVFVRDISFTIENKLIIPNIIEDRKEEVEAISHIFKMIPEQNIIRMSENARAEGGDVMPWNDYIFVGYSQEEDFNIYKVARTNVEGVDFLKEQFPNKIVRAFELNKSDIDPKENALHLDCCFQPIGTDCAIIYKGGFKNEEDVDFLVNLFLEENIIFISKEEMYHMNSNVFSISEKVIVSEKGFTRLNNQLRKREFIVEEIQYSEISKMEGLLRCSTLPLKRK
ncbi:MAG: amidinotransferase [Flavobacteriales bacterium]|jgi:N-dimethylarginine dimethylaminohydrolase|nr:amidinotransferase [Flavobacteriales bacterium]MBT6013588.1 amidinotransferase [Flavobacteriales bacterium]MBT7481028.1 amidinotransferase [Flavobacteriales bacterium]